LNRLQELIYNRGERLVPYVSHDNGELVRHRSSYAFFHRIIAEDTAAREPGSTVSIVDLGFGSGYGCALLSSLRKAQITGVDISPECKDFANQYYARTNVDYLIEDLTTYIPSMNAYDYVVSRGVLEHVPGGLNSLAR
jgi:2-polyprenyl-3-methyl-5-hydroxy-6-metoxy-1,4-benzoquinol methylase